MAWSIGGTTLNSTEQPHAGSQVEFVNPPRWSKFRPIGYTGAIMTLIGFNERQHLWRLSLLEATKDAIKAHSDAGIAIKLIGAWDPYQTPGVDVVIERCFARKNATVTGAARWDTELLMVEV